MGTLSFLASLFKRPGEQQAQSESVRGKARQAPPSGPSGSPTVAQDWHKFGVPNSTAVEIEEILREDPALKATFANRTRKDLESLLKRGKSGGMTEEGFREVLESLGGTGLSFRQGEMHISDSNLVKIAPLLPKIKAAFDHIDSGEFRP